MPESKVSSGMSLILGLHMHVCICAHIPKHIHTQPHPYPYPHTIYIERDRDGDRERKEIFPGLQIKCIGCGEGNPVSVLGITYYDFEAKL